MKRKAQTGDGAYMVPVVRSTFQILAELSRSGSLKLNEITQRTGLPKSTVFRILRSLHELGYALIEPRQRAYSLSPNLADLARPLAWGEPLRNAALPHMLALRDQFGETVNLGELNLDRVVYLEVVPSEHSLRLNERRGEWVYAHTSALGKAILAFSPPEVVRSVVTGRALPALTPNTITTPEEFLKELETVRARGYAFDNKETTMLAACVGVPLLDRAGIAFAGISISGPGSRFTPADRKVIRAVVQAARKTSEKLCSETDGSTGKKARPRARAAQASK